MTDNVKTWRLGFCFQQRSWCSETLELSPNSALWECARGPKLTAKVTLTSAGG